MQPIGELKTSSASLTLRHRAQEVASVKLGGITLWAPSQAILDSGLQALRAAIEDVAKQYLTTARPVLRKLVRDATGHAELDDKIFSAVLGATLRSGQMDALVCGSKNDKAFRVFIHATQIQRWNKAIQSAMELVHANHTVAVRELERVIFGVRAYNTWSSSSHVIARLSYLGIVELDDDGCRIVRDLP